MAFTVRSWFHRHQAQVKTWLLATLLGLSWFPLSYSSPFLGRWLAALSFTIALVQVSLLITPLCFVVTSR